MHVALQPYVRMRSEAYHGDQHVTSDPWACRMCECVDFFSRPYPALARRANHPQHLPTPFNISFNPPATAAQTSDLP